MSGIIFIMTNKILALNISSDFPIARNFGDFASILNLIIPLISISAAIILLIMFFFGAFTIIKGGDNPEEIKRAKSIFTWALLGMIIIVSSFLIVKLIGRIFNISLPL